MIALLVNAGLRRTKIMNINLKKELRGTILDIGGGGEGVIGQVYIQSRLL